MNQTAWCYDLRSGWSEVEDVVATDDAKFEDALAHTGFEPRALFTLGEPDSGVHLEVHVRSAPGPGSRYYIAVDFPGQCDSLYAANLPSLLALLRDFAPILQAGFLHSLMTLDFNDYSMLDLLRGALRKVA